MSEAPRVPPLSKPATTQRTRLADALKRQPYEPTGTIGAPYRGTLAELLGDGGTLIQRLANKLDEYAVNIPIPGQSTTLADLVRGKSPSARLSLKDLTLGNAGQVIEDWSYGSPPVRGGNLATGGIGTYGLKPEALDLFNLAPPVAAAANLGRKGARALAPTAREMVRDGAESFMDGIGARPRIAPNDSPRNAFQYPQDDALETARRNAVSMLGLPENNTAMERAAAMGFDTDAFHASNQVVNGSFDVGKLGENTGAPSAKAAIFAAKDPATTHSYIWSSKETSSNYYNALRTAEEQMLRQSNPGMPEFQLRNLAVQSVAQKLADEERGLLDVANKLYPKPRLLKPISPEDHAAAMQQYRTAINRYNDAAAQNSYIDRAFNVVEKNDAADAGDDLLGKQFIPYSSVTDPLPNIMPLKLRAGDLPQTMQQSADFRDISYADAIKYATDNNAEGVVLRNTRDGGPATDIYAITNPARIRSRFAAFDPARINDPDLLGFADPALLGTLGGSGLFGLGAYKATRDEKKPAKK